MQAHQQFLLGEQLDHIVYLDRKIARLDEEVARRMEPVKQVLERLDTITGIAVRWAQDIIAEIGPDASHFPSDAHLSSWGGLTPGQNESAASANRPEPGSA